MTRRIIVVGAVIVSEGRVLAARRGPGRSLPGAWEFPGGKIEDGESPQEALAREVLEELRIAIRVGDKIITTTHEYEFGVVTLTTYYCEPLSGVPQLTEHSAVRWLAPDELPSVEWAPADVPAVERIRSDFTLNESCDDRETP
ncbi:DNA mismatch repair protein MutT [Microbacterium sp. Root61]|uniref:(deoxy)nucleoside triphosphate pyrophosphohydrolase n=1 Tax=Microbacterium sp. Root61 TaxID=1736570 RepID=UPI0006FC31DE|nr:(deoxy)nucleoside triphosphate pyrophosphohydrolase [Microbacterium sp. Root61]KRA24084.1 DNA mismatch repair protein MutT [Microbacterium sp. Root61]